MHKCKFLCKIAIHFVIIVSWLLFLVFSCILAFLYSCIVLMPYLNLHDFEMWRNGISWIGARLNILIPISSYAWNDSTSFGHGAQIVLSNFHQSIMFSFRHSWKMKNGFVCMWMVFVCWCMCMKNGIISKRHGKIVIITNK